LGQGRLREGRACLAPMNARQAATGDGRRGLAVQ
jgi:hypothetical protein